MCVVMIEFVLLVETVYVCECDFFLLSSFILFVIGLSFVQKMCITVARLFLSCVFLYLWRMFFFVISV